jgi:hypothetical protein
MVEIKRFLCFGDGVMLLLLGMLAIIVGIDNGLGWSR